MSMLLNDIVKQAEEKPQIDWDAYCRWRMRQCGSLEESDSIPMVWKCSCGAVNTAVAGEKFGTCRDCGLVYLSFPQ